MKNAIQILTVLLFAIPFTVSAERGGIDYSNDAIRTLLPFDAIPAILEPQFVSADKAKLEADAPVIGVSFNEESRAYSLYLLNGHEIVNDVVGAQKIATTWCPLCKTAIVYSRKLEGNTYTFGVSGKLWRDAMLMYDHQTRSLWSHITGEAVRGKLKGKRLKRLAAMPQIAWSTWELSYPTTQVLSVTSKNRTRESERQDVYADYHASKRAGVSGMEYTDDRLANKALVIGVEVEDTKGVSHYRAYPLPHFVETSLINDTLNGVPLLIFHDKTSFATAVFARALGGSVLTFTSREQHFAEDATGTRWNLITGVATRGKHKGAHLERLPAVNIYWFAWARYHPQTSIHR